MTQEMPSVSEQQPVLLTQPEPEGLTSRSINIRKVPPEVWKRARQCALESEMPFRDYLLRILAQCQPVTRKK